MTGLIIDNKELADEFFADARLIGIQCPLPAHQFVWLINQRFFYRFIYQPESEIKLREKQRSYIFPIYCCKEENWNLEHILYVNENDGKHLLPELKHIDYLWLLKGIFHDETFKEGLMHELRSLSQVQVVLELTNEKIRNKQNLIL